MFNRDFEKAATGLKPKTEFLTCPCGSTWFEPITASRYDVAVISYLGQAPMEHDKFHLFRCLKCGDLQEPHLADSVMSPLRKDYDDLLDTLEEKQEEKKDK